MTGRRARIAWGITGGVLLGTLLVASWVAPDFLSTPKGVHLDPVGPFTVPPFGADDRGIPLLEYALQGAAIVTGPALLSGMLVMVLATLAGLVRCAGLSVTDSVIQGASEVVGALPRMVVILVVAMILPMDWKGMLPIGLTWALLASPGAMDEAASTAGRLGGERFVEALRAHGFSRARIYGVHVVWLNLRPVLVRQGAEVTMQVVFLEIALSYLALRRSEPAFTHLDSEHSWATLLYQGYTSLLGTGLFGSLVVGLGLVALVATMAQALRLAARAR